MGRRASYLDLDGFRALNNRLSLAWHFMRVLLNGCLSIARYETRPLIRSLPPLLQEPTPKPHQNHTTFRSSHPAETRHSFFPFPWPPFHPASCQACQACRSSQSIGSCLHAALRLSRPRNSRDITWVHILCTTCAFLNRSAKLPFIIASIILLC